MPNFTRLSGNCAATLNQLCSLLEEDEVLTEESEEYKANSQPWAAQKDQKPPLVIRPTSVKSLSTVVARLYSSDIDFAIRGHGFSSASAKDVIVSMTAFDDFEFDTKEEWAVVGAGQTWSEVYDKMEKVAPDFALVGARTPAISVGGTVMNGGYSWLSREYGCISDPVNMLDAEIVKGDGTVAWASSEPDLLWALRGGGGGFCVAVRFIFRARRYPRQIWAGPILLPQTKLSMIAKDLAAFVVGDGHPRTSMFLYVLDKRLLESIGAEEDTLVIHAFDANGEVHGREAFKWALELPGAIDQTGLTTLKGVADLQAKAVGVKGTMKQFWSPLLIEEVTERTITRCMEWFSEIQQLGGSVSSSTYLAFELLCSRDSIGSSSECAWPRPAGSKHVLLLGPGCSVDAGVEEEDVARQLAIKAPEEILGKGADIHLLPAGVEDFHDVRNVWRHHYDKLVELKHKYDPQGRFKGSIQV